MIDWLQIKNEYIRSNVSCRELAEKYGLSPRQVSHYASKEQWPQLRKAYRNTGPEGELVSTMQTVADKLLRRLETSVDDPEVMDVKDLRALVSALKDLVSIREACPELERQARVAELEQKLDRAEGALHVVFQAGEEGWNE